MTKQDRTGPNGRVNTIKRKLDHLRPILEHPLLRQGQVVAHFSDGKVVVKLENAQFADEAEHKR